MRLIGSQLPCVRKNENDTVLEFGSGEPPTTFRSVGRPTPLPPRGHRPVPVPLGPLQGGTLSPTRRGTRGGRTKERGDGECSRVEGPRGAKQGSRSRTTLREGDGGRPREPCGRQVDGMGGSRTCRWAGRDGITGVESFGVSDTQPRRCVYTQSSNGPESPSEESAGGSLGMFGR